MTEIISLPFFLVLGVVIFYVGWFTFYVIWSSQGLIPKKDEEDTVHTTRMEFDVEGKHIRTQQKGYRKYRPWKNK